MGIRKVSQTYKESADLVRVYRPRWWFFYWVFAVCWSLFVVLDISSLIVYGPPHNDWVSAIIALLLFGAINVVLYLSASQTRIVVTSEYLEYYGIGYCVRAQWKDLLRIQRFTWKTVLGLRGAHNPDCLILRRAVIKGPKWLRRYIRFIGQGQMITIGSFDRWWRQSALGDDIRFFAPQLNI